MAVVVAFMKPGGLGSIAAVGIGQCRVRETLTVPATTTASAQAGEIALILSTETAAVLAAHGAVPDGQAVAAGNDTTAGYPVAPNLPVAVATKVGDKINVKALV